MGIEQLVDAFKGNPAPLEAKLKKDQQGQPPGAIPPDLEEAMALQKITEIRNGAQNQQAMQAGGAQPSIVEKLRQMLAANQRQQAQPMPGQPPQFQPPQGPQGGPPPMPQGPQGGPPPAPQGQPVMAARGGSIDQLMSNLGRHYAGGGIVAFNKGGGGDSNAEDSEYSDEPLGMGSLPQRPNPLAALARLVSQAVAREKKPSMMLDSSEAPDITPTETPKPEKAPAPAPAPAPEVKKLPPAPPRPPAANINAPAAQPAPDNLRALLEASIRKDLGKDENAEWAKGSKRYEDFMGIDKLLQPREARIAERQEMMKRIQGDRTPAWVEALAAAGKPVRGGLGTLLNQMGGAAEATRKGYSNEDLKFFDEIGAMQDEVAKLKLDGKYKAAAAGEATIKDAIANKRQAEQSGTSLLNTDELTRTRLQAAREALAGRMQSAGQHNANMALALEEKKRQFDENQLRKIREKDVERAAKIESEITKRTGLIDMQLQNPNLDPDKAAKLAEQRKTIVKQVMEAYPSVKPEKPTESQFLAAARAANPGVSDADLKAYYKQNYGS
jgi:hypothetical protein